MKRAHLVVKATLLIQEVEELGVSLAPPEVEVANLKVTPDFASPRGVSDRIKYRIQGGTYSGSCCMSGHRHRR